MVEKLYEINKYIYPYIRLKPPHQIIPVHYALTAKQDKVNKLCIMHIPKLYITYIFAIWKWVIT